MTKVYFKDANNDNWMEPKRTKGGVALACICAVIAGALVVIGIASAVMMILGQ